MKGKRGVKDFGFGKHALSAKLLLEHGQGL